MLIALITGSAAITAAVVLLNAYGSLLPSEPLMQLAVVTFITVLLASAAAVNGTTGKLPRLKRALNVWLSARTTMYSHKAIDVHQKPKTVQIRKRDEHG